MSTLTKYLDRSDTLSRAELCAKIGVTKGRLSQLRNEDWPPDLALKAEAETGGGLDAGKLSSIIARARKAAA